MSAAERSTNPAPITNSFQEDSFLHGNPQNEPLIPKRMLNREDFGLGNAGERAYKLMLNGEHCERKIDFKTQEMCPNEPTHVLDFDIAADLEQVLICSDLCRQEVMAQVEIDLSKMGRSTVFGTNGFGRA